MAYSTLITGPERRRRWDEDQKLALLAEALPIRFALGRMAARRNSAAARINKIPKA